MCVVHDDNRDIAKLCNELRKTIGMSIAELARRIGVDRKRLWYVLNGQREIRVDEFLKICVALKTDPKGFIDREMLDEVAEATRRSIEKANSLTGPKRFTSLDKTKDAHGRIMR